VKDAATYEEPTRPAEGIHAVIVNGGVAWEGGRSTGVRTRQGAAANASRQPTQEQRHEHVRHPPLPTPLPVPVLEGGARRRLPLLSGVLAMDPQTRIIEATCRPRPR
jgi:hypothetical protein